MMAKYVAKIMIGLGLLVIAGTWYLNSRYRNISQPFSTYTLLMSSWEGYKERFINDDGRVIDFTQNNMTTSEGQSYGMLRAVFVDDKETFDELWGWTKDNLKREKDELFGWKWGERSDGQYDFLEDGGENSASDADSDIALALILAQRRWGEESYLVEAKKILKDMWRIETAMAGGKRYMAAGNWAIDRQEIVVNPSYMSPYAWRIFDQVDELHWKSLVDPAYELLELSSNHPLDKERSVGLPPDWVIVERAQGTIKAVESEVLTTNYSYDAMRIPFRLALDYEWFGEERAREYLKNNLDFLNEYWQIFDRLATTFQHDGKVLEGYETPAMYATALPYFKISKPQEAKDIYERKILRLYSTDKNRFNEKLEYYDQNWLWFGTAFYNNYLTYFDEEQID